MRRGSEDAPRLMGPLWEEGRGTHHVNMWTINVGDYEPC